ncbi:hypothetical protein KC361_g4651 [Hortaea werneckii]|nr:hypothetical protein KC361_g4651 [Hortaea werneckii]
MDYAKKKNDELISLCKERGLQHTGKKSDFVKRLEEYDAAQKGEPLPAVPASKAAGLEDDIDWDDEPAATAEGKAATTEAAKETLDAGGVGEVKNPVDVPNQTLVEDPAKENELSVAPPASNGDAAAAATAEPAKEKSPEKDFTSGIGERTIEEEIEKRKARARKFGLPEDSEEIKLLERAKRFGTSNVPGLLNAALTTDKKEKKRAAEALEEGNIRKRSRGPKGGRGRGMGNRRGSSRGPKPERDSLPKTAGGQGSWMMEEDKKKAEARKARFGAPA